MAFFIGREAELAALDKAFRSPESQFIPIYGRRRVGKSELIRHFIKDKPALYFLGKKAPEQLQLRLFMAEAGRIFDRPVFGQVTVHDWKSALSLVTEQVPSGRRWILVLDEFQWMAQASPSLPSIIQELWDVTWSRGGNILLILCGSYLGFMEREVLGKKSPLFGRRTAQILLRPFSYREAAFFHPRWSNTDRAKTYFICGGIPYYLRFFERDRSIHMNIRENFLDEFSALSKEVDFLLREELRELEKYHGVLLSMATGSLTSSDIAKSTGIKEKSISYYLNTLIQLGYIARRRPLTTKPPSPRDVRFQLDDPLLRFWFKFVYPHSSSIVHMGKVRSFNDCIKPQLDSYFGMCFETLCREALPQIYRREEMYAAFEIGEYWDKEVQIDVVGLRQDHRIDIGECKWGPLRSGKSTRREVMGKVERYPNEKNYTIVPRLFVRTISSRQKRSLADIAVHTLDDIYFE